MRPVDRAAFYRRKPARHRRAFFALTGLVAIAAVVAVGAAFALSRGPAATGPGDTVPYGGTPIGWPAPDFELTDQNGVRAGLSDHRGRVVVLAFLDSRCDESCPITAFELRLANLGLGDTAGRTVFLGVNVNRDFNSVVDVHDFTTTHLLHEIPTWRFLTGDVGELSRVWSAYSVEVIDQADDEDYEHTPGVFIIDQDGVLRWYVSTPLLGGPGAEPWDGPRLNEIMVARIRELLDDAVTKGVD